MSHRLREFAPIGDAARHDRRLHVVASTVARVQTLADAAIRINLLDATIVRPSGLVRLTGRDLELVSCIALRDRPVSRATLIADIWPDSAEIDAANALYIGLHRLRKRLGRRSAICLTRHGYVLGAHVSTDFHALETFEQRLRRWTSVVTEEIELISAVHQRLVCATVPTWLTDSRAGEMLAERIEFLKHGFAKHLAMAALRLEHTANALDIAHEMVRLDSCDESAWEIIIRAHLANRDRGSAIRDFRMYSQNLARELGIGPSWAIKQLIVDRDEKRKSVLEVR